MVNIVHVFTISYVAYDIKQVCERELVNNSSQNIFMRLQNQKKNHSYCTIFPMPKQQQEYLDLHFSGSFIMFSEVCLTLGLLLSLLLQKHESATRKRTWERIRAPFFQLPILAFIF